MSRGPQRQIAITLLGAASGTTLAFSSEGQLRAAVIVKATFAMVHDGPMTPVSADPIVFEDTFREGDPSKSLTAATDRVPYRPQADVLLRGHAWAPGGKPVARSVARLMIARGQKLLIDKRITLQGGPSPHGAAEGPWPFTKMPLVYELAAKGSENPVGKGERQGDWPSICDAWSRPTPVGFGPINPCWPQRRRLLKDPTIVERDVLAVSADFPWAYFQAAPEDQRTGFLRGDEWIGFEGMNASVARLQSQLPRVRGVARVYGPDAALYAGQPVVLHADTITIDTDSQRVSVVWRGSFPVARATDMAVLHVFGGVEIAGATVVFPATYSPPPGASAPSMPAVRTGSEPPQAVAGLASTAPSRSAQPSPLASTAASESAPRAAPQPDFATTAQMPLRDVQSPPSSMRGSKKRKGQTLAQTLSPPVEAPPPSRKSRPKASQTIFDAGSLPAKPAMPFKSEGAPPLHQTLFTTTASTGAPATPFEQTRITPRPSGGAPATPFEQPRTSASVSQTLIPASPPVGPPATPFEPTPPRATPFEARSSTRATQGPTKPGAAPKPASPAPLAAPPNPPSSRRGKGGKSKTSGQTIALDLNHQLAAQLRAASAIPYADDSGPISEAPHTAPGVSIRNVSPLPFVGVGTQQAAPHPGAVAQQPGSALPFVAQPVVAQQPAVAHQPASPLPFVAPQRVTPQPFAPPAVIAPAAVAPSAVVSPPVVVSPPAVVSRAVELRAPVTMGPPPVMPFGNVAAPPAAPPFMIGNPVEADKPKTVGESFLAAMARAMRGAPPMILR